MKVLVFFALLAHLSYMVAGVDWDQFAQVAVNETLNMEVLEGAKGFDSDARLGPVSAVFNCQTFASSGSRPTSVHQLRPSDISVIGAIGDSLTAANGAKAALLFGVLEECRGLSWSMGGERDLESVVTLPNILRRFNPNLYGYSTGSGNYKSKNAIFNAARPGHTSHEMYEQAKDLVNRMKSSNRIDFNNDWKVITFFVGGNDLCDSCHDRIKFSSDNFVMNLQNTLDFFNQNLPKALINLVVTLDIIGIQALNTNTCNNMHKYLCDCGISDSYRNDLYNLTVNYQKRTEDLIATGRYDRRDDFTVVVHPFMKFTKPPTLTNGAIDYSYFAPDCFHFTTKGHATFALELWNSMLTPIGKKNDKWTYFGRTLFCPTAQYPYIFTNKNSNVNNWTPSS